MDFCDQIKQVRTTQSLTQEQFAQKLNVSRQAVSNWERGRNLPDIELLITIAEVFHISLDQLILGGNDMNPMAEKLIRDGSETRRTRMNMISACIGTVLFLLGIACILIKANSVEYIDSSGILHENFFLIPISFLFFFGGFITFLVTGIRNIVSLLRTKSSGSKAGSRVFIGICIGIVLLCAAALFVLYSANS